MADKWFIVAATTYVVETVTQFKVKASNREAAEVAAEKFNDGDSPDNVSLHLEKVNDEDVFELVNVEEYEPEMHFDGLCPYLFCVKDEPHEHPICPECGAVMYSSSTCPTCQEVQRDQV